LLVAAALVAFALEEPLEAIVILAVLVINTVLGAVTEVRARSAVAALLALDSRRAFVVRAGRVLAIDARGLVPGDIIEVNPGQHVPADGRVLQASDLRVDESPLTGESLPVSKSTDAIAVDTPLADRVNMVYKGTTISAGTARVLVTGTGRLTELGRIGVLVDSVVVEATPLERRLDGLGHRLVWVTLGVAALVAGVGVLQGQPAGLVLETAIALAVAAIPEALPAVATIALAVGVRRMAHRRALVRRLPAVEALGSTTVVCTDKTRTLTSGDMTVVRVWAAGQDVELAAGSEPSAEAWGDAARRAIEVAALASRTQALAADADSVVQDPVDAAMLRAAERIGVDRTALVAAQPATGLLAFSSARKLMASFHQKGDRLVAYAKGAPQQLLDVCARGTDGQVLDQEGRDALMQVNDAWARAGLRVLALAEGPVDAANEGALAGLSFVGFVGIMDPPAPGVRETIAQLRRAGMRTVMLTGDQHLTAEAVGRALGVLDAHSRIVTGRELDDMSKPDLEASVGSVAVFSRISPEHKLNIVSALQAQGEIVAMLGDGVNDAAALRKADVGVAMGRRGTDVAKEAAAIVLQDDRFETIAAAVEEGRIIFDNIRKFVFYLFSCNVAEVMVLLVAGLAGWPMPLLPLQLLWLNMVTDTFPALALAMEPGDQDVMQRPPRDPGEAILSRSFLLRILGAGGLITAATLAAFGWALVNDPGQAQAVAFQSLAFGQILHLVNARSETAVTRLAHLTSNRHAVAAVLASIALQLVAMYLPPLAGVLRLSPLSSEAWLVVLGAAVTPALVGQGVRWGKGAMPNAQ
ncbi:MAG TPA: cation-transporting P-type ATPase, partial [Vicinamibacterales bacterium]